MSSNTERSVNTVGPPSTSAPPATVRRILPPGRSGAVHDGDLDPADGQQKRRYQAADPRSDHDCPVCPHDTMPFPEKPIEVSDRLSIISYSRCDN